MSKIKTGGGSGHLLQRFCRGKEIAPLYTSGDHTVSHAHKVFEACHEAGMAGYRAVSVKTPDGKDDTYVFSNGDWHHATWAHGKWGKLTANQPASIRLLQPIKD